MEKTIKELELENLRLLGKLNRAEGEYSGFLRGILMFWEIPKSVDRKKLEDKLEELEKSK